MGDTYTLPRASVFSFPPLLSKAVQVQVIALNETYSRIRSTRAAEDALLEDIHKAVLENEIVEVLQKKIREPYTDYVSVDIFRGVSEARIKVDKHEYPATFRVLLHPDGKILKSLNKGLGEEFKVLMEEEGDYTVLKLEFRPKNENNVYEFE